MPFADSFMIGIMAQVAQWEREQISKRTKAALKVAKERGKQIGGDRGNLAAHSEAGARASAEKRSAVAKARSGKGAASPSERPSRRGQELQGDCRLS